jgi:DNA processing protein
MLGVGAGPGEMGPGWDRHETPVPEIGPEDRDALAVLLSVHGMGPLTLARLVDRLGSPSAILALADRDGAAPALVAASRDDESGGRPMFTSVAEAVVAAARRRAEILADVTRSGLRVVTVGDVEYPSRLRAIELPPPALFVRGSLEPLRASHVVAVVGTRRPSPAGRRIASRIGSALARAGATVVSGLAVGIDGAAHAACVTEKVPTIAFIGGGHAVLFPRAHDRLADAIVAGGGAVISEYAPRTAPTKGTFPQRNRLISGAADAVVVVEAGASSGALVTASWALEQGRECFVVPGPIDASTSAGCNGFLRDWPGLARVVSGVPQLLDDLGLMGAAGLPAPPPRFAVDGEEEQAGTEIEIKAQVARPSAGAMLSGGDDGQHRVADALVRGAVTVDEIVASTGLSVGGVLGALTRLEAIGLVRGLHGRYEPIGSLAAADPATWKPAAA